MSRKLKQVSLLFENEDGSLTREVLIDEQAEQWDKNCQTVASCAYIHNMNPDWTVLKWTKTNYSKPVGDHTIVNWQLPPYMEGKSINILTLKDKIGLMYYMISTKDIITRLSAYIYNHAPKNAKEMIERDALVHLLEYFRKNTEFNLLDKNEFLNNES